MALPTMPGQPTPTPSPKPASPSVSAGDYLATELARLQAMNQNQSSTMPQIVTYVAMLHSTVAAAEL